MKRITIASLFHCLCMFIGIFCYVNLTHAIPQLIPGHEFSYKMFTTLSIFFDFLPAILLSSYVVAYATIFGKDDKHIMVKYSPYILSQFKYVAIFTIVGTGLLVCGQEVGTPLINQKLTHMLEAPSLYQEYMQAARKYDSQGDLVFAIQYARAAELIDPNSQEAITLKGDLEVRVEGSDYDDTLHDILLSQENLQSSSMERNATSHELLQKAQQAYQEKSWLNAHYYSILAKRVAEPGSANEEDAKIMAADAWNMLAEPGRFENDEAEERYRQKKLAYSQLMAGNVVEAYYKFSDLLQRYPTDEDVRRYHTAATMEMESQYFFLDEIPISDGMEDSKNVAFRIQQQDGSERVVFIKGLSSVGNTGGLVQYARGLSIYDFGKDGQFKTSLYVPYAKILSQTISSLDERTRRDLAFSGLDPEKDTVPMIMLESVDRIQPNSFNKPVYNFAEGAHQVTSPIVFLPMDYKDFLMLKNTSLNPEEMMLTDIIRMVFKAQDYGYAQIIYGQAACNRMSTPLLFIVLFLLAASVGWNYRIMSGSFRVAWSLTPILLTMGCFVLLIAIEYMQKLLNYGLFGFFQLAAVPIVFFAAILLVFLAALFFLARRSQ